MINYTVDDAKESRRRLFNKLAASANNPTSLLVRFQTAASLSKSNNDVRLFAEDDRDALDANQLKADDAALQYARKQSITDDTLRNR